MENTEVKLLFSKLFKKTFQWASQSYLWSLIILSLVLIVGIPLLEYLQGIVKSLPYSYSLSFLIMLIKNNFSFLDYFFALAFLIIFILLYSLYRKLENNRVIRDRFNVGLNRWAIPLDSGWTVQNCLDMPGKMLTVTNSGYPGTLKGAYTWYDYSVNFLAKIDKTEFNGDRNFTFVIRSENNINGVMLQITKTQFRPHLLYNGVYIVDNEGMQNLPTILEVDSWIKVKVVVKGSNVEITLDDFKLQYKIPNRVYSAENELLSKGTISLENIKESDRMIQAKQKEILDILGMPASAARDEALKTIDSLFKSIPPFTRVLLEYQKGSVGFREFGEEKAHFRSFKIKQV